MPRRGANGESLTDKQKIFVEAYLSCLDAKKAAILAGYKKDNANVIGCQNLTKLKKHIQPRLDIQLRLHQISESRILQEEACIAYSNPKDIFDRNDRIKRIKDIPDEVARAISSFDITEKPNGEVNTKVKFWDKGKSLNRLGNYLDMYNKENVIIEDRAPTKEERMKDIEEILSKFDIRDELKENGWDVE